MITRFSDIIIIGGGEGGSIQTIFEQRNRKPVCSRSAFEIPGRCKTPSPEESKEFLNRCEESALGGSTTLTAVQLGDQMREIQSYTGTW